MQTLYWPTTTTEQREDTQLSHRMAVENVIRYMRTHVQETLSLDEMAELACLSPFYFSRVFHNLIGVPPGEYLSSLRLEAAKRLLLKTSLSITDICFEVGYSGLGSFTSRFTQLVGLSPRRLRVLVNEGVLSFTLPTASQSFTGSAGGKASLYGTIRAREPLRGFIFIGLFPKPIPQGHPVRCTMILAPGPFCIEAVPPGKYYVMVAAFPVSEDPQTYILPELHTLAVGSYGPVLVLAGGVNEHVEVMLRPMRITDPPLLSALPYI